jgi:putative membrane protein
LEATLDHILDVLGGALPTLLAQFGITVILLAIGVALYQILTPFHERSLVAQGNSAAGIVLTGAILALAIPLASTLATSTALIDIVLWGIVGLVLQLVTLLVVALTLRGLKEQIERGNDAAALTLAATQVAVALLNAGAMAG